MLRDVILQLWVMVCPYLIPFLLALFAYFKRVALAKASAQITHDYNSCLEVLKYGNKRKINIHKTQFDLEMKTYQSLWNHICKWRREFRKYTYENDAMDNETNVMKTTRKEYFATVCKFQELFDAMVRAKPFVYGEVLEEVEAILRKYESEISTIFHERINTGISDSDFNEDRVKTLKELDRRVYKVLSEKIRERIGLIEVV